MLKGEIILKGDKSITHRAIMLVAITEGKTKIMNPSNCIDVQSSIDVLNMCGSNMFYDNNAIIILTEEGQKLGYVPQDKNEVLSKLMDAGKLLFGRLDEKSWVDDWLKLDIQVYLRDL